MKENTFERIFKIYKKLGFKHENFLDLEIFNNEKLKDVLLLDKKSRENRLNIILPINIGDVRIFYDFDVNEYIKIFYDFIYFLRRSDEKNSCN